MPKKVYDGMTERLDFWTKYLNTSSFADMMPCNTLLGWSTPIMAKVLYYIALAQDNLLQSSASSMQMLDEIVKTVSSHLFGLKKIDWLFEYLSSLKTQKYGMSDCARAIDAYTKAATILKEKVEEGNVFLSAPYSMASRILSSCTCLLNDLKDYQGKVFQKYRLFAHALDFDRWWGLRTNCTLERLLPMFDDYCPLDAAFKDRIPGLEEETNFYKRNAVVNGCRFLFELENDWDILAIATFATSILCTGLLPRDADVKVAQNIASALEVRETKTEEEAILKYAPELKDWVRKKFHGQDEIETEAEAPKEKETIEPKADDPFAFDEEKASKEAASAVADLIQSVSGFDFNPRNGDGGSEESE